MSKATFQHLSRRPAIDTSPPTPPRNADRQRAPQDVSNTFKTIEDPNCGRIRRLLEAPTRRTSRQPCCSSDAQLLAVVVDGCRRRLWYGRMRGLPHRPLSVNESIRAPPATLPWAPLRGGGRPKGTKGDDTAQQRRPQRHSAAGLGGDEARQLGTRLRHRCGPKARRRPRRRSRILLTQRMRTPS